MSSNSRRPGAEQPVPTPHTEENSTADGEIGDRDPEAEELASHVRRNLEGAAETVGGVERGHEDSDSAENLEDEEEGDRQNTGGTQP